MNCNVSLLGPFTLKLPDSDGPSLFVRKTRAALGFLVGSGCSCSRRELADLLFPDVKDPSASLRWHLSRIRKMLGAEHCFTQNNRIFFEPNELKIDALIFEKSFSSKKGEVSVVRGSLSLYRGEFLEDLGALELPEFEIWLLGVRNYFARIHEKWRLSLIWFLCERGLHTEAIEHAKILLRANPLEELYHAWLIYLYSLTGQEEVAQKQLILSLSALEDEAVLLPGAGIPQSLEEALHCRPHWFEHHPYFEHLATIYSTESNSYTIIPNDDFEPLPLEPVPFFVGRKDELEALSACWSAVCKHKKGATMIVEAEAGGGKSSLIKQFCFLHSIENHAIGHCYELTTHRSYFPWLQIAEMLFRALSSVTKEPLSTGMMKALNRLIPQLFEKMENNDSVIKESSLYDWTIRELITKMTTNIPYLLFIDDLQWSDRASLRLFQEISQISTGIPLLLVGAFRMEEKSSTTKLFLDGLHQVKYHLQLPFLSKAEILDFVALSCCNTPQETQENLHLRLYRESEGHPLVLFELLKEWKETEESKSTTNIPKILQALTDRRLSKLSKCERQLVEWIAIFEIPVQMTHLQLFPMFEDSVLVEALERVIESGLIKKVEGSHVGFGISHALLRRSILSHLSDIRRVWIHQSVASLLEKSQSESSIIAFHWREAGMDKNEAIHLSKAAERALEQCDFQEGIYSFSRALALYKDSPNAHIWLRQLGLCLMLGGRYKESEEVIFKTFPLCVGDEEEMFRNHLLMARLMLKTGKSDEALKWVEKTHSFEKNTSPENTSFFWSVLGEIYTVREERESAFFCLYKALDFIHCVGDTLLHCRVLNHLGILYTQVRMFEQATEYFDKIQIISAEEGYPFITHRSLLDLGNMYTDLGQWEKARESYLSLADWNQSNFSPPCSMKIHNSLGYLDLLRESYPSSFENYKCSILISEEHACNTLSTWISIHNLGEVSARMGLWKEAVCCALQAFSLAQKTKHKRRIFVSLGHLAIGLLGEKRTQSDGRKLLRRVLNAAHHAHFEKDLCFLSYYAAIDCIQNNDAERFAGFVRSFDSFAHAFPEQEFFIFQFRLGVLLVVESVKKKDLSPEDAFLLLQQKLEEENKEENIAFVSDIISDLILPFDSELSRKYKEKAISIYHFLYKQNPSVFVYERLCFLGQKEFILPFLRPKLPAFLWDNCPSLSSVLTASENLDSF